jgi:hypothetical protein
MIPLRMKSSILTAAVVHMATVVLFASAQAEVRISRTAAQNIGQRVWKNECGGTVSGLTSWNRGEDFPSLGIGHFIWYPRGKSGPFEESFPQLLRFMARNGVEVPAWLRNAEGAPWPNRAKFEAQFNSAQMRELRTFLVHTVPVQAEFLVFRLEKALPKMEAAAPRNERAKIRENFYRVANSPTGPYALIDYVNFKGEGTNRTERYKGEGWGLLQVLTNMKPDGNPLHAFSSSAEEVLTRRVRNSPPSRNESKWLPGWKNRVRTYVN